MRLCAPQRRLAFTDQEVERRRSWLRHGMGQSQGPSESEQSTFLESLHKAIGVYYEIWKCK